MHDCQIDLLKLLANNDKDVGLHWWIDGLVIPQKVVKISPAPKPAPNEEPEPTDVAWLEDGSYVALSFCELREFCFINRMGK
jgi:hypothetical protein